MLKDSCYQNDTRTINETLTYSVIEEAIKAGVSEFCVCPGARNAPFVSALNLQHQLNVHYWFEERSAAFFALGLSKKTDLPVAVVVTSGTAAGELLPATMEAYYSGIPLLLITADRPSRYRNTGAPQTAEQVGLYGIYAKHTQDLEEGRICNLSDWDQKGPAHINICLEEPLNQTFETMSLLENSDLYSKKKPALSNYTRLNAFLINSRNPFVIVSTLKPHFKEAVVNFLLKLGAPVYLEAISGIREDARLEHLQIFRTEGLWEASSKADYEIDAILRIGGVPTIRLWRDLEEKKGIVDVYSINDVPFSGLSWGDIHTGSISEFFEKAPLPTSLSFKSSENWINQDQLFKRQLEILYTEEPDAEPSMVSALSVLIPKNSRVFLGTSLPIREWDMAACRENRDFQMAANRGLNGIDGELSTFFGWSDPHCENWAILGDLTTLYDMAAPWILSQLPELKITVAIINNGGGKIFHRMFPQKKEMLNLHNVNFAPFAALWNLSYQHWTTIPKRIEKSSQRLIIEIVPDDQSTERFWRKFSNLCKEF
jgi:2-succinyl-5-enolpyruvyl-6-hydroxy-3-cyclohexene-1-carboxylate synthase